MYALGPGVGVTGILGDRDVTLMYVSSTWRKDASGIFSYSKAFTF